MSQEKELELDEQHKRIVEVVQMLKFQAESLSSLCYDILTTKPSTPDEWDKFIHRYNLIESTNGDKETN